MSKARSDRVLFEGSEARLVMEADDGGRVASYLVALASGKPKEFNKVRALLERAAEVGPQNIHNNEKVRALGDGLFEFKSFQVRIFWMYGNSERGKRTVVLLDAVTKQTDRHRPRDIKRARALMKSKQTEGSS